MASSTGNSPHRFSGTVDAFYDPDFTADISNKMRVPDRIVIDADRQFGPRQPPTNRFDGPDFVADIINEMRVPDQIIVCSDQESQSPRINRSDGPDLTADTRNDMRVPDQIVIAGDKEPSGRPPHLNGYDYQQSFNASTMSVNEMSDEGVALRRQLKALSRRVAAIELENQHRRQREVIVCTIGVIYFLIKGLFWAQKRF